MNPTPPLWWCCTIGNISVVQSLLLRIVVQWGNFVGYCYLRYNKGLYKTGETSIEQGFWNKCIKNICRLCKIGWGADNISPQPCPLVIFLEQHVDPSFGSCIINAGIIGRKYFSRLNYVVLIRRPRGNFAHFERGIGETILLGLRGKTKRSFIPFLEGKWGASTYYFRGKIKQSFTLIVEGKSSVIYPCF